jgi:hypothetical protein
MELSLTKEAPVLIIDVGAGIVGFVISIGWWRLSGRTLDRDALVVIGTIFGGLTIFGAILAFVM